MKWIEFENEKPKNNGYYLCAIIVNSMNQYGASTEYKVLFFSNRKFENYPIKEIYRDELVEHHWVEYWCKIETPIKFDV